MRNRLPFLESPADPSALLRLADGWATALEASPISAYRAVNDLVSALASVADGADAREWALVRAALSTHRLTQLLRRDPLVAHAWRGGNSADAQAMLDDLMLRHPERDPMVARADRVGQNVYTATSSLPACDAARDRRRLIFGLADSMAERGRPADILAITPGYMREVESSVAGPAGGIARWVALLPTTDQAAEISRAMPMPWVVPLVGSTLATLLRRDILGSFDLVYCKAIETMADAAAEALAVAAFSRLRPGGRMLLGCRAPGAIDAAFWSLCAQREAHLREEARLARLVTALPPHEVASRTLFSGMNEAICYVEVEKRA
jgi:hypothetical protein